MSAASCGRRRGEVAVAAFAMMSPLRAVILPVNNDGEVLELEAGTSAMTRSNESARTHSTASGIALFGDSGCSHEHGNEPF